MPRHATWYQTYAERSEADSLTPLATYLLRLMHVKRTNLCVSADVASTSELLRIAEEVGEHICVLKTHADIINDFSDRTIRSLSDVARRKQFVIFEDRKFGDIGNTVQQQYTSGPLQIVRWAPIVNAHLFPGPAIITALSEAARKAVAKHNSSVQTDISASPPPSVVDSANEGDSTDEGETDDDGHDAESDTDGNSNSDLDELDDDRKGRKASVVSVSTTISTKTETISPEPTLRTLRPSLSRGNTTEESDSDEEEDRDSRLEALGPPPFYRGLLLLAQMSSKDNFFTPDYATACADHARANRDFVMGFIAQQSLNSAPNDTFITMTPGVQLAAGGDAMGQQYHTPHRVIYEAGSDIIIVGRGILAAPDRRRAALEYRKQGWTAYEERLRSGRRKR